MTTSITTGFPNQEENTGEKSFIPSVNILDGLPSPGIDFAGSTVVCSASAIGNLFKSEQSVETQIMLEVEDDEAAGKVAKVLEGQDRSSCRRRQEARDCVHSEYASRNLWEARLT